MGEEIIGKSFRSGNSVAIRLPAALGIEPGREWTIRTRADGALVITPKPREGERIDLTGIAGSVKGIERVPFEEVERDWSGLQRD